ncbi:MAG: nickel pincer cofactor biosynthesis protein LarB [Pseudomonadota bacterium]
MSADEIRLDFQRPDRVGFDEAILCAGKSLAQLETIVVKTEAEGVSCLMTRLQPEVFSALPDARQAQIDYDPVSCTGYFNWTAPDMSDDPQVAVVAAGSSDMPQAQEAIRTLTYFGIPTRSFIDVGVAGLWRLTSNLEALREFPVLIAVAGMDGALPSVLGGLVPGLIIVLPTSTGYGASRGGETALNAALASCAPGLTVVNIDNGYGAACAALRATRIAARGR